MQSEVEKQVNESVSEIMEGVKNTVSAEIESRKALATLSTSMIEQEFSHKHIEEVINSKVVKESFQLVGVGFESDKELISNDPNWVPSSDYNPLTRGWYTESKKANDLIITAPYADSLTNEILVSIAMPVHDRTVFAGSIFFDVSLGGLADIVNKINLFKAGYLFLVSDDGTTIAHPKSEYNGLSMSKYLPTATIQEGVQYTQIDDIRYAISFKKVDGTNWFVGAVLDEQIAFSSVYELRDSSIIYTLIALVMSIVILLFIIQKLMAPLTTVNIAIQDIASGQGDLTKRLDTNTDQEFSELAKGFNTFTESLQLQIKQSKEISGQIMTNTDLTSQGAERSVMAVDNQLQELEQLATAMHEMATTSTEVATSAQHAATAAKDADDATQKGNAVVEETRDSIEQLSTQIDHALIEIQGLETATSNIDLVLKVITDIADQTNLLALNAAIEAARAGESGRGFAVVADEVRTLAKRTQESTTEIRTLIDSLKGGAHSVSDAMSLSKTTAIDAVDKSDQANRSLGQIHEAIMKISDMSMQIASAAEEQSLVAEEINNNTVKIKDLSTQVANVASESNEAMHLQVNNVREQDELLNKFIV